MYRIGTGYDSHIFTEGRDLIIGGIKIDYEFGLKGHSDADVLIHSIIDAILGSLALGDIGRHFPDTSEKYKDISSVTLLKEVLGILKNKNYSIVNVDATIICEKPKLGKYIDTIRKNMSDILCINIEDISVKAKTNEGMDDVGSSVGIVVHSVVLVKKSEDNNKKYF